MRERRPKTERLRMTVPHVTRPLAAASIAAALTTLRARGLRVSAARRLVLEALFAADGPANAILVVDPSSGSVVDRIAVGASPWGVVITP